MQSEPGAPWAPLIVAPYIWPEARRPVSLFCLGCHRPIRLIFVAVGWRCRCGGGVCDRVPRARRAGGGAGGRQCRGAGAGSGVGYEGKE
jgi:hypothetical protein